MFYEARNFLCINPPSSPYKRTQVTVTLIIVTLKYYKKKKKKKLLAKEITKKKKIKYIHFAITMKILNENLLPSKKPLFMIDFTTFELSYHIV